jgi:hypothetical protein
MDQPSINFSNAKDVCAVLKTATQCLRQISGRVGCTHHLPSTGQLLVTGDLHDNPFHLSKIIKLAKLDVPTNHVVLQELIHSSGDSNELDLSYRMLVRVASLVVAFPSQVHPILANHELSQATGRAITKGGGELVNKFNQGVKHVFGKNTKEVLEALDKFILAMPLAVKSSSGLLCMHSLPNELLMDEFDMDILDRELQFPDLLGSGGSAYLTVWGRQHSEQQVNALAEHWGVSLFCLGHAWVPSGIDVSMPNVILLNSDHANGAVLPIQLDNIQSAHKSMRSAIELLSVSIDQENG